MRTLSITETDAVAGGVAGGYGWKVVYQAGGHTLSGGNNSNAGNGGRDNETGGSCTPRLVDPEGCRIAVENAGLTGFVVGSIVGVVVSRHWAGALLGAVSFAGTAGGIALHASPACARTTCPAP